MSELNLDIARYESDWIALLVDGELTDEQTRRLFEYLDNEKLGWKRCATALLDDRLIRTQIGNIFSIEAGDQSSCKLLVPNQSLDSLPAKKRELTSQKLSVETANIRTGHIRSSWWQLAVVAGVAFLVGAAGQRMLSNDNFQNNSVAVRDQVSTESQTSTGNATAESLSNRLTPVSFESAFRPHTLMEIEDSPTRAVYLLDHEVPAFLLEALVVAGHRLHIGQELVVVSAPDGETMQVPINKLEIEKYVGSNP